MFFVEADAENPVAAGCIFSAISMLYLESADAAIPAGTFAGYAFQTPRCQEEGLQKIM